MTTSGEDSRGAGQDCDAVENGVCDFPCISWLLLSFSPGSFFLLHNQHLHWRPAGNELEAESGDQRVVELFEIGNQKHWTGVIIAEAVGGFGLIEDWRSQAVFPGRGHHRNRMRIHRWD